MPWRTGVRPAAAALLGALVAFAVAGRAAPSFPDLTGPVVDQASIIDEATESRLDRELRAFQQASGRQLVVATVPSLQGYDIRDYGNGLFRHWQLGDKDRNDGVLLLVAAEDRRMSIEVGYGLEATLPDAISKIIIEYSITPRFREGDFAGGIALGVGQIMRVLKGEGEAVVAEAPRPQGIDLETLLIALFLLMIVLILITRINRGRGIVLSDRSGGGWSGGGGYSGGGWSGGGGYSGGGGSSGGGGASGSW